MDQDKIDKKLAQWSSDLKAATSNLAALQASSAYRMTKPNLDKLTGKSKTKVAEPVKEFDTIWEHFVLLCDVIKKAEDLHKNIGIFNKGEGYRQIEELLTGQSIILKAKEIPLAKRGLTGASQEFEKTDPPTLWKQMQETFANAAKAVDLYESSYLTLTDNVGKTFEELDKTPDAVKRQKLEVISTLIDTDPVTGMEQFKELTSPKRVRGTTIHRIEPNSSVKTITGPDVLVEPSKPAKKPEVVKTIGPTLPTNRTDPKVDTSLLDNLFSTKPTPTKKQEAPKKSKTLDDLFGKD